MDRPYGFIVAFVEVGFFDFVTEFIFKSIDYRLDDFVSFRYLSADCFLLVVFAWVLGYLDVEYVLFFVVFEPPAGNLARGSHVHVALPHTLRQIKLH